jgi:hypothetical protein
MLGYNNDKQLHNKFHLMTFGVHVRLLISWHEYAQSCCEAHAYVQDGLQVDLIV